MKPLFNLALALSLSCPTFAQRDSIIDGVRHYSRPDGTWVSDTETWVLLLIERSKNRNLPEDARRDSTLNARIEEIYTKAIQDRCDF